MLCLVGLDEIGESSKDWLRDVQVGTLSQEVDQGDGALDKVDVAYAVEVDEVLTP